MTKRIHRIWPDGRHEIEEAEELPAFEDMQKFVEGWVERVKVLYEGKPTNMVVNEEGLLKGMELNSKATEIYHAATLARGLPRPEAVIVGPAMLFEGFSINSL